MRRLMIVCVLSCAGFGAAFGESAPSHDDADACQPDIHRLCENFFPDEALLATCLVDRRAELSEACAKVLARPTPEDPKLTNRAE